MVSVGHPKRGFRIKETRVGFERRINVRPVLKNPGPISVTGSETKVRSDHTLGSRRK